MPTISVYELGTDEERQFFIASSSHIISLLFSLPTLWHTD
jgi:hypothetical protein